MKRLFLLAALFLAGCASTTFTPQPAITDLEMRATMAVLSSDEFEGRMPGTEGEEKTIAYIAERFQAAGLESGARGPKPFLDAITVEREPTKGPLPPGLPAGQAHFITEMNTRTAFTSHNVIGVVRGRNPDGKAVVLMAHWDHLGLCLPEGAPDRICNGAVDNASGIAAMIAVAERVVRMKPDRDVWFVATTAEEWGLLGAKAFADNPPLTLESIVAGFNLDTIAVAPAGMPVAIVAADDSPLKPIVVETAAAMGRRFDGDGEADSFLRRQDGWALAQKGVPMILVGGNISDIKRLQAFLAASYHGVDDELRPELDISGAVEDANLHVELIRRAASRQFMPITNR